MNVFDLFWMTNDDASIMTNPYKWSTYFLGLINGPDWGNGFGHYFIVIIEVKEVNVCLSSLFRAVSGKVTHLATFETCLSWSCLRCAIWWSVVLWSSPFFHYGNLTLVPLISSSPSLWSVSLDSIEVHGDGGVIHLIGSIRQGPLLSLGIALSSLVIILVRTEVKGARLVVILEWVWRNAIPPSNNVVNCLLGSNCFYCSLF